METGLSGQYTILSGQSKISVAFSCIINIIHLLLQIPLLSRAVLPQVWEPRRPNTPPLQGGRPVFWHWLPQHSCLYTADKCEVVTKNCKPVWLDRVFAFPLHSSALSASRHLHWWYIIKEILHISWSATRTAGSHVRPEFQTWTVGNPTCLSKNFLHNDKQSQTVCEEGGDMHTNDDNGSADRLSVHRFSFDVGEYANKNCRTLSTSIDPSTSAPIVSNRMLRNYKHSDTTTHSC